MEAEYLLVAISPSEQSRRAGKLAVRLAKQLGVELRVLSVMPAQVVGSPLDHLVKPSAVEAGIQSAVTVPDSALRRDLIALNEIVMELLDESRASGVNASYVPLSGSGDVVSRILSEVKRGCVAVVLGAGERRPGRLGNVAEGVAKRSPVPVVLVP
ncbi:MAG: universal stress protein [Thaumarchaeota archaeon]|nr:universal stress protein [Candidatus Calditenuaceae archaeon]MCX8203035.1 universal stress protein [Nitrososphaeria archaeon]MDW8043189.1 universal stress protein [Nitrososphaerota archaeon]